MDIASLYVPFTCPLAAIPVLIKIYQLFRGERRQSVLKQSVWAILYQIVEAVRGLLVVPFAIHYVGLGGYGLWVTVYGLIQASTVFDLGLTGPFQKSMANAYARNCHNEFNQTLLIGIIMVSIMASIVLLIGLIGTLAARWWLEVQFIATPSAFPACIMAAIASALSIVNTFLRASGTAQLKPGKVLKPMLFFKLVGLGLTILFFTAGMGVAAISAGLLIAEVCILLIYMQLLQKWKTRLFIPSRQEFTPWFDIARITFFSRFMGGISERLEPTIIGVLISVELASVYSIGKKLATFIDQILHTIWAAMMAPLANYAAERSQHVVARKFIITYTVLFGLCLVMYIGYLFVNSWFIHIWVGSKASAGLDLYILIALALASTLVFDVFNETFILLDKPKKSAAQYLLIAIGRLAFMSLLGYLFGINGIVSGIFCANFLGSILSGAQVMRHFSGHASLQT